VPSTSLFCVKCDSFQGSVAKEQYDDGESRSQLENLAVPVSPAPIVHVSRPRKLAQMSIGIAIAFLAGLMILVVHARTVNTERHFRQPAAIALPDEVVGSTGQVFSTVPLNLVVGRQAATETKGDAPHADSVITMVRRVEVLPAGWGLSVVIVSSRPITPRITELEDPPRIVLDFANAQLSSGRIRIQVAWPGVTEVRASQFLSKPPGTRVVVALTTRLAYSVESEGNKMALRFTSPDTAAVHEH